MIQTLGGERSDLFIFVSALTKNYYYFINKTKYDSSNKWTFSSSHKFNSSIITGENRINDLLNNLGYIHLDKEDITFKIHDVETEFCNMGEADVFSCLFTDVTTLD